MTEPRHHTQRSDLPTRGGQAAAIAAAKGRPFLPWQRRAADVALEYHPSTGLYRFGTIVLTVQRQAGKTTLVGVLGDHRCLSRPNARVWFTMDTGKKADSWMREEHLPTLRAFGDPKKAATRWRESLRAGELGPKWPSLGSTFLTFPPTRDGLHSKQSDLVILSEAWALSMEQGVDIRQAARPTMNSRYQPGMHGAQMLIDSTLGDDSSVFLDSYYEAGVASLTDPTSRVCFIDYGIPEGADATDLDVIREWHPAYGSTFTEQALQDAVVEFEKDPAGFARAYGNVATRTRETAISAAVWTAAGKPKPPMPDRAGLALDVTPSGDRAALYAGWRTPCPFCAGSPVHGFLEPLHSGPASRDLPRLIVDLTRKRRVPLVVDRASIGALEVVDAVARISPKTEVRFLTMGEYAGACGSLYRGILDCTTHHANDPALTAAVEVATKRNLGDGGFGWGRKGSAGSIADLVAGTIALKAFDLLPAVRRAPFVAGPSV